MYKYIQTFAIAGLQNVGFIDDDLIVLSTQGTGIFNCLTGEKIGRDNKNWWENFDKINNNICIAVNGDSKIIKTFGLFNSNETLPLVSPNGWKLIVMPPQPDDPPFEKYLVQNVYLVDPNIENKIFVSKDGPCELRAFGFSKTGKSFVVALSCELTIWAENN